MNVDLLIAIRRLEEGLSISLAHSQVIAALARQELERRSQRPASRPPKWSRWPGRLEALSIWLLRQAPATYPQIAQALGITGKTEKALDTYLRAQVRLAEKIVDLSHLEAGASDHGTFAQVGWAFDALAERPLEQDLRNALSQLRVRWRTARADRELRGDAEELTF